MSAPSVELRPLPGDYVVVRMPASAGVPDRLRTPQRGVFVSITRTPQELSIVCPAELAPAEAQVDGPWTALYAGGPMPFDLTGVVSSLVGPLSAAGCPVFVLSTFDGDIIMVPSSNGDQARELLTLAGHSLSE